MRMISVFVPYYNDSEYLKQCIESVLSQSYECFELILLNHASTDGSEQIAKSFTDDRIKHISLPKNIGAGGGLLLREFLKIAQGEYIKLFCADDVMEKDCLKELATYLDSHPEIDIVFGNVELVNYKSERLKEDWFDSFPYFDVNDSRRELLTKYAKGQSVLPYISNLVRRSCFENVVMHSSYVMLFDMTIWIQMFFNGCEIAFIDRIVALYRLHKGQLSGIASRKTATKQSDFEFSTYLYLFYDNIRSVDEFKKIYCDSPFCELLNDDDEEFVEFAMARHYLELNQLHEFRVDAYIRISKMLNDEQMRKKLEDKFAFGVGEFRAIYSDLNVKNNSGAKSRLYNKSPKELNSLDLGFLLLRRFWCILSIKPLITRIRGKKRYLV